MKRGLKGLRLALLAALASMAAFALAACGGGQGSQASASSGGVTLEFQQWWGVELPRGALEEICQAFANETGINIKLLSNPYADTRTQISVGAATGTMADIVGLDGAWVYDFAKQGAIANLTELMSNAGYDASELLDQIKVEGSTYMIPVVNFGYPLYVNLGILEEAGVAEMPATWSEFLAACDLVVKNTGAAAFSIPLSTEAPNGIQNQFMTWLWASGGSMLTADGRPNLAGNAQLEAVAEFVKQLYDSRYLSAGAAAMREQDMVNEFENGRLAFMVDGISHLTTISNEAPNVNFDYIKMPVQDGFTGQSGMDVANWGIGIAANCGHKAEAWQFVAYLMSPEVNARLAEAANAFPGNARAQPDYSASDARFQKAFEMFQSCYAVNEFTGLPTSEDLMRSFNGELILYLDGETANAADMLAAVQAKWEPAFK